MGAGASCGLQNRFGGLGATWVSSILTSSRQRVYRASVDRSAVFLSLFTGETARAVPFSQKSGGQGDAFRREVTHGFKARTGQGGA